MAAKITGNRAEGLKVPDEVIIPFIEGDGVGPEVWAATRPVIDAAVAKAYDGARRIAWQEVLAGEKAHAETGQWLPEETLQAFRDYKVGIKGPLATPVGGGIRSLNVTIRQTLDLYACIRPCKYIPGMPAPVKQPELVDMVVFRENTEDVYAGLEWKSGTPEAEKLRAFLKDEMNAPTRDGSGIGIKPMSPEGSKRLVRMALEWALARNCPSLTLVHKGNIMKYTEGAFRDWGYELARDEFGDQTVPESQAGEAAGKVVIKDRIADAMFQNILLEPENYSVLALPNLNGDYISDALAAQTGGLGMAPGANVGDFSALFEATHGTAPTIAGKDEVNPGSLMLSGAFMLEYMGWLEAAHLVEQAITKAIAARTVTADLARQMDGATTLKCSEFGSAVVELL